MSKCKPENISRVCKYIQERRSGDFIETHNWRKDYLGFSSISQSELDSLCHFASEYILKEDEYILNSMGEIMFGSEVHEY